MKYPLPLLMTFLLTPSVFAVDKLQLKSLFCVRSEAGAWELHRYPPLIDFKGNTIFAELWTDGSTIERMKLRRFFSNREVTFEYRYDPAGDLKTIQGTVDVRGSWVAEADLPAHGDPEQLPHEVRYYGERRFWDQPRDKISVPQGASRYLDDFKSAPRFMTTRAVPCADKLSKVERVNATQK